jgi:ribosomal protein L37AE/L43A
MAKKWEFDKADRRLLTIMRIGVAKCPICTSEELEVSNTAPWTCHICGYQWMFPKPAKKKA